MKDQWKQIDQYLERSGLRVGKPTLRLTTQGGHAHGSLHYAGLARDYSIRDSDGFRIARKLEFIASDPNGPIEELFFAPLDIWYKNGEHLKSRAMRGKTQFSKTESPFTVGVGEHMDHCHVALKPLRRLF